MIVLLTALAPALACGPDYPPYLLSRPLDDALEPPVGDFDELIAPLTPPSTLPDSVAWSWRDVELADAQAGLPAALVEPWMEARTAARAGQPYRVPEGLPAEYALYLEGSAAWAKEPCKDTAAFERLLQLPPEQRHNRTTWARYSLGFCGDSLQNGQWPQLRADVLAGFADRWGLAASSYGWEAARHGRSPEAFHLYLAQASTQHSGVTSLLYIAPEVLDDPAALAQAAADPKAAAVISAYLVSRDSRPVSDDPDTRAPDRDDARRARWLDVARTPVVGAGTLAWLAYQDARYEEAARWAAAASPEDGWAAWVDGRLALREGRAEHASTRLGAAAARLPGDAWETLYRFRGWDFAPAGEAAAERAGVLLRQEAWEEALTALLPTRYWVDAAYVAERVLTLDELVAYVDAHVPARPVPTRAGELEYPWVDGSEEFWGCAATCAPELTADRLRWLLARRLVRAGRLDEAVRYAPERHRARFEGYRDAVAAGADIDAARRMRVEGLEIAGTELDPDYAIFGGNYELAYGPERMARTDALAPGEAERARYAASAPSPDRRYHYRFVAGTRLRDFAAALPDTDLRAAWAYCTAGRWVQSRDADLASRWYFEAIRRRIDRSNVVSWFGDCGEEPRDTWWWPWRRQILWAVGGAGALAAALLWRLRWRR